MQVFFHYNNNYVPIYVVCTCNYVKLYKIATEYLPAAMCWVKGLRFAGRRDHISLYGTVVMLSNEPSTDISTIRTIDHFSMLVAKYQRNRRHTQSWNCD